jgi:hypothetical protein
MTVFSIIFPIGCYYRTNALKIINFKYRPRFLNSSITLKKCLNINFSHWQQKIYKPMPFVLHAAFRKSILMINLLILLILLGIRKNCLISGRSLLLCQFTRRTIKVTVVIIVGYHCYQLHTKFDPKFFSQG